MQKKKIYLAGPDVFYPNAIEIGNRLKQICEDNDALGLFPLDNEIHGNVTRELLARLIVEGNKQMIQEADMVFANLSNFRGSNEHPCCDSGTAWECGYALGLGKTVIGYTYTDNSIPIEIVNQIHLALSLPMEDDISEIFKILNKVVLPGSQDLRRIYNGGCFNLDPPFSDIQDANSLSAFCCGIRYALGSTPPVTISDKRSQVEKYGTIDKNGNSVEDFGYSSNIMIALSSRIVN